MTAPGYSGGMTHAVLSAVGPDRPGLVEDISQFVFERGGNIETSRMVNLGGQFCVMMLISANLHALERLTRELPRLQESTTLRLELVPARETEAPHASHVHKLIARGQDRAGMLHQISHLLRVLGINIESVSTRVTPASDNAPGRFEMEMTLAIPAQFPRNKLDEYLGHLWEQQPVEWQVVES
jgi:glycine cleavage system transcriptional repressor